MSKWNALPQSVSPSPSNSAPSLSGPSTTNRLVALDASLSSHPGVQGQRNIPAGKMSEAEQQAHLNQAMCSNAYPDEDARAALADEIDWHPGAVYAWFKKQRGALRRKMNAGKAYLVPAEILDQLVAHTRISRSGAPTAPAPAASAPSSNNDSPISFMQQHLLLGEKLAMIWKCDPHPTPERLEEWAAFVRGLATKDDLVKWLETKRNEDRLSRSSSQQESRRPPSTPPLPTPTGTTSPPARESYALPEIAMSPARPTSVRSNTCIQPIGSFPNLGPGWTAGEHAVKPEQHSPVQIVFSLGPAEAGPGPRTQHFRDSIRMPEVAGSHYEVPGYIPNTPTATPNRPPDPPLAFENIHPSRRSFGVAPDRPASVIPDASQLPLTIAQQYRPIPPYAAAKLPSVAMSSGGASGTPQSRPPDPSFPMPSPLSACESAACMAQQVPRHPSHDPPSEFSARFPDGGRPLTAREALSEVFKRRIAARSGGQQQPSVPPRTAAEVLQRAAVLSESAVRVAALIRSTPDWVAAASRPRSSLPNLLPTTSFRIPANDSAGAGNGGSARAGAWSSDVDVEIDELDDK